MSDTHGQPNGTRKNGDPVPEPPLPIFEDELSEEVQNGTVDFNYYTAPARNGGEDARQAKMSDPTSGGSVVSWAELLRQQARTSDDEVILGSLPELQIDSI